MDIPDFRVDPADYSADFNDLRAVREAVFVLEQNVPLELEWDKLDPHCHHVVARDFQNQPIGTGRLTPDRKIGRMAVLRPWRGKGVGESLLRALIEQARDLRFPEVTLNAQVSAIGFYEKFGFTAYGDAFEEAGIQHQSMRLAVPAGNPSERPAAAARPPSVKPIEFEESTAAIEATRQLILQARRELWIYTRDLEPGIYAQPEIVDALKQFAISGRDGIVKILVQDTSAVDSQPHPLLALAKRLPSAFELRTPIDPVDMQYPSAFVANDCDGYLFRLLGSRFEGDWSPTLPARNRQLSESFERVWERCRACTEFRALEI
jgi:predicted GNAT family N-acyltransferase